MRKITVVIANATGPDTRHVLGWDEQRIWVTDWNDVPESLIQVQEFARATAVRVYGRGNLRTTLNFTAHYEMDSYVKAAAEAVDIRTRIPRAGDVEYEMHTQYERQVRWLRNATIQIGAPVIQGVALSVPYTITGGAWTL